MKRTFRHLLNFVWFGVGFGLAAATISHFVPTEPIAQVTLKLDWLKEHAADYDVLFLGSSRMRQLEPSVFNQVVGDAGLPCRAFNLAADGMRPPEDAYILDQALKGRTAPVRLVLVEGNSLAMRIGDDDFGSDRMTYWHDSTRMATIWDRIWAHEMREQSSFRESVLGVWRNSRFLPGHVQHWLLNSTRAGRGSEMFHALAGMHVRPRYWPDSLGTARDGYVPNSSTPMNASDARAYTKSVGEIHRQKGSRLDPADSASQAHFEKMKKLVQAHGGELVIVAPPILTPEVFQPLSRDIIFLDFSDPLKYPQLFAPAVRLNAGHTNAAGSQLFTRLLAQELVTALAKKDTALKLP